MPDLTELAPTVPADSRPYTDALSQRTGRLLNIHARMAASPAVIAGYSGLSAAIATHGTFDARTRETIALAVGNENECDYCQAAHTASARRLGFTNDEIIQIRAVRIDFDAKLSTIASLARTIAADTGAVPPELRQRALNAGWTRSDLEEAFVHVAVNLYTNYFNHYAGTELDFPPAEPATLTAPSGIDPASTSATT